MIETSVLSALQKALQDLRYGTVQLTIHDGKLVRIERLERIRLPSDMDSSKEPTAPSGGKPQLLG